MTASLNLNPIILHKYVISLLAVGILLNIGTGCSTPTKSELRQNLNTAQQSLDPAPSLSPTEWDHFISMGKSFKTKTSPAEYEELGDQYYQQNNLHFAITQYKKALELDPSFGNIPFKVGVLLLDSGNTKEARTYFNQVLEKTPHHALAHEGLARAYFKEHNDLKAAYHFHLAAGLDSSLWRPHFFLGLLYDQHKRHALAILEYKAALVLQPSRPDLYNNLGMAYYLNKQFYRSIQSYRQALRTGKPPRKIFNNLGLTYARLGKYRDAHQAFTRGSDPATAHNNLGIIFLQKGYPQVAIGCFVKAIALYPSFYVRANENLKIARENLKSQETSISSSSEIKGFSCKKLSVSAGSS
jgi:tetratricopeptide (TPR) repeat protein